MKYLILILIMIAFILIQPTPSMAQRCGDFLWFSLSDENGQPIAPSKYESVKVFVKYEDVTNNNRIVDQEDQPEIIKLKDGLKIYSVRTICGLMEARFKVVYHHKTMNITIKNIPEAGNFILKDLKFTSGSYQIDIGGRAKLHNCRLLHESIFEGNLEVERPLRQIENEKIERINN